MSPAEATKVSGKLQWTASDIFQQCAKAALRVIIRRQSAQSGNHRLTARLRYAIKWFIALISNGITRFVSFDRLCLPAPAPRIIVYSDADGHGNFAAVAVFSDGRTLFARHFFPRNRRRRLVRRSTQIIAFELWAAAIAILTFVIPEGSDAHVYVDNQSALRCLINTYSSSPDLNNIAGGVMYELSSHLLRAHFSYVESAANLADGPSRNDLRLMQQVGAREVEPVLPAWAIDSLHSLP